MTEATDFWTRRKAAVKAEAKAEKQAEELTRRAEEQAELEEKSDEEILAELKLPDPDAMQQGDDFSVFMAKAVPARLRRRALRRLWLTNPVLANLDELLEYGEDFTDAATVVENLQTAYQVGKGMLEHVEKMAESALQQEEEDDSVIGIEEAEDGEQLTEVAASADKRQDSSTEVAENSAEAGSVDSGPMVKRRMRFNFSQDAT